MKQGNIISFRVYVDAKGILMTEYSKFPKEKVKTVFKKSDIPLIEKVLREMEPKLDKLHDKLEDELNVFT